MASTTVEKQIKADVIAQLVWDNRVDARDVNVEVEEGGRVRLSGNVPSNRARRAAEQDAWVVNGVLWVDNLIAVEYPSEISLPSDSEIAENIKNMLMWDSSIDASGIKVTVTKGKATLQGSVDAYWKKIDVEDIALSVAGVLEVINHLVVVPTQDIVDETIARDIEGALERNVKVNADSINVKVEKGKVTLTGTVPNGEAFRSAYDAALYAAGVTEVENKLVIESY